MRKEILEPFCFMKNLVQKLTVAAVAVMPVFLCGCPGASYVDNEPEGPKGYVVKMKNDYSDKVIIRMSINFGDTTFCCPSIKNHTTKLVGDYYKFNCSSYDGITYSSIKYYDWHDSLMEAIHEYIIDTNPFDVVYAYYESYDEDKLKSIIEKNEFGKFERKK